MLPVFRRNTMILTTPQLTSKCVTSKYFIAEFAVVLSAFFPYNQAGAVMSEINDQDYLREKQYRDASNLNARIRLHVEFSTNKYGWFRWVFDQYELPARARVLELGCGPGDLWLENINRIPKGWQITLSDFSPGMLAQSQEKLSILADMIKFKQIDAQSIPYEDDQFDIVIANHFLYHVPDRSKALSEIRRVLKPGGRFYATTIGVNHMKELPELVARFDPENGSFLKSDEIPFNMENGEAQIRKYFSEVEERRYQDELRIRDVDVLVDYIFSGMRLGLNASQRDDLTAFIHREMAANGGLINIHKDSGMFIAQ
jgi:ubiquinone/menaquinone biosynthesis C-methylase UbiE